MKKVKFFLASSINEFKEQRHKIGNVFRELENELIEEDIRLHLFVCEFADNSIYLNGIQKELYNKELEASDVFIMLIGKRAGMYTIEEYDVASKCENMKRYILVEDIESDESVTNFIGKLNEDIEKGIYSEIIDFDGEDDLVNHVIRIINCNIENLR